MKLQKGLTNEDCLVASFAMACDVPIARFKDGLPERGVHHIQECVIRAFELGYAAVILHQESVLIDSGCDTFINTNLHGYFDVAVPMVLIGTNHAVAYGGGIVFDPKGHEYDLKNRAQYKMIVLIYSI